MKRVERTGDYEESLLDIMEAAQANIWTALPGIIQSFDTATMTCSVQPAIQARLTLPTGDQQWLNLPLLTQVPVIFPAAGGYTLTFPIALGDECLVVFSSRCIDRWWLKGGIQLQNDIRMHHLSDGFVIPGARSQPRVITGIATDATELRNDTGTTKVRVKDNVITLVSPTEVVLETPLLKVSGDIRDNYHTNTHMTLKSLRDNYNAHKHGGVQTGSGTSDIPDHLEA
jgi:hypothetical protein